jgi:hypothetical protein
MTRGIAYSKPLVAAGAAALVAASAMFWMHRATSAKISELRRHAATEESDLLNRINAMSAYESENVDSMRRQVGRFRMHLGTEATWDILVSRLGNRWVVDKGSKEEKGIYSVQLVTLRLVSHAVGEWPSIVEAVGQLEAIPGVGIAEFEMKTSGADDRRSLDTARILVAIQTSRAALNSSNTP